MQIFPPLSILQPLNEWDKKGIKLWVRVKYCYARCDDNAHCSLIKEYFWSNDAHLKAVFLKEEIISRPVCATSGKQKVL